MLAPMGLQLAPDKTRVVHIDDPHGKKAMLGALSLYLDFINLFMIFLQLFGQRRDN